MAQISDSIPKQVYWHEGLFMRPQHLQQQDLFTHNSQYALHRLVNDQFWGVIDLEFNEASLQNEVLDITSFDVLFEDGARVNSGNNNSVLRRSFSQYWRSEDGRIDVWLALKKMRPGYCNVSTQEPVNVSDDIDALLRCHRYHIRPEPPEVYDLFRDDKHAAVSFIEYQLLLLFGKEVDKAADFECVKLAEIIRTGNSISISDKYIPPLVSVHASPVFIRELTDLNEYLYCKSREFGQGQEDGGSEYKSVQATNACIDGRTVWRNTITAMLNRYVCLVDHMLAHAGTTMQQVLLALHQLAAELQAWSPVRVTRAGIDAVCRLEPYSHRHVASQLFPLLDRVRRLLAGLSVEFPALVPLRSNGEYFFAELDKEFLGKSSFYLLVKINEQTSNDTSDSILDDLHHKVKISSVQRIAGLITHCLPGVSCKYEDSSIAGIQQGTQSRIFRLNQYEDHWRAVNDSASIAVHVDASNDVLSLTLVGVSET